MYLLSSMAERLEWSQDEEDAEGRRRNKQLVPCCCRSMNCFMKLSLKGTCKTSTPLTYLISHKKKIGYQPYWYPHWLLQILNVLNDLHQTDILNGIISSINHKNICSMYWFDTTPDSGHSEIRWQLWYFHHLRSVGELLKDPESER